MISKDIAQLVKEVEGGEQVSVDRRMEYRVACDARDQFMESFDDEDTYPDWAGLDRVELAVVDTKEALRVEHYARSRWPGPTGWHYNTGWNDMSGNWHPWWEYLGYPGPIV